MNDTSLIPKRVLPLFVVCLLSLAVASVGLAIQAEDPGSGEADSGTGTDSTVLSQVLKKLERPDHYAPPVQSPVPPDSGHSYNAPEAGERLKRSEALGGKTGPVTGSSPPDHLAGPGGDFIEASPEPSSMLPLKKSLTTTRSGGRRLSATRVLGLPFAGTLPSERYYYDMVIGKKKSLHCRSLIEYDTFSRQEKKYFRSCLTMIFPEKKVVDTFIMTSDGTFFVPVFFLRAVEDQKGKLVRTEEIAFYSERGRARVVREILDPAFTEDHESSENMDMEIDIPPGTYSAMMYALGFQVCNLKVGDEATLHLISRQGLLTRLKIKVEDIVEVGTPLKTYFCYLVNERPDKFQVMETKFSKTIPNLAKKMALGKSSFCYSIDPPHRLVAYLGCKDFGPISLNMREAGELFEDYIMEMRLTRHETLEPNDVANSDLFFAKLEEYQLFEPLIPRLKPPSTAARGSSPGAGKLMDFRLPHAEVTPATELRLRPSGSKSPGSAPAREWTRPSAISTPEAPSATAPQAPPEPEPEEVDRQMKDLYEKFYKGERSDRR